MFCVFDVESPKIHFFSIKFASFWKENGMKNKNYIEIWKEGVVCRVGSVKGGYWDVID